MQLVRSRERERESYERLFYSKFTSGRNLGRIYGFPFTIGAWCNDRLKVAALELIGRKNNIREGAKINTVQYLGIALDEPKRIAKHKDKPGIVLPLVDIGWDEKYCREWCEENNLLSPIYTTSARGGCWFCHNQGVDQLRLLRKDYPELWQLLLKWDEDSPTSFKPNGHTVHDFEKRFQAEDEGRINPGDKRFKWKQILEEKENQDENA